MNVWAAYIDLYPAYLLLAVKSLAGATAVEVGAANLINPYASRDIVNDLPRVMEKYGIRSLSEIIGQA